MANFEFHIAFALSRMIIFEVSYYTLRDNKTPYFTTSVYEFNQPKTDWKSGGQGQDRLLPDFPRAYTFYKKWDGYHLSVMTRNVFEEMWEDVLELCKNYNYLLIAESHPEWKYYKDNGFGFYREKALSMIPIKKTETNHDKTKEILG